MDTLLRGLETFAWQGLRSRHNDGYEECRVLFWAGNAALERLKPVRAPRNLSSPARNPAVHCEHQSTRCALIGAHEREFACPFGNATITSHRTAFYTVMYAV
jgi:hypothetical protein